VSFFYKPGLQNAFEKKRNVFCFGSTTCGLTGFKKKSGAVNKKLKNTKDIMPIQKRLRRRSIRTARRTKRPSLSSQEKKRIEELKDMLQDIHKEVNQIRRIRFGNKFGGHPLVDHFGFGAKPTQPNSIKIMKKLLEPGFVLTLKRPGGQDTSMEDRKIELGIGKNVDFPNKAQFEQLNTAIVTLTPGERAKYFVMMYLANVDDNFRSQLGDGKWVDLKNILDAVVIIDPTKDVTYNIPRSETVLIAAQEARNAANVPTVPVARADNAKAQAAAVAVAAAHANALVAEQTRVDAVAAVGNVADGGITGARKPAASDAQTRADDAIRLIDAEATYDPQRIATTAWMRAATAAYNATFAADESAKARNAANAAAALAAWNAANGAQADAAAALAAIPAAGAGGDPYENQRKLASGAVISATASAHAAEAAYQAKVAAAARVMVPVVAGNVNAAIGAAEVERNAIQAQIAGLAAGMPVNFLASQLASANQSVVDAGARIPVVAGAETIAQAQARAQAALNDANQQQAGDGTAALPVVGQRIDYIRDEKARYAGAGAAYGTVAGAVNAFDQNALLATLTGHITAVQTAQGQASAPGVSQADATAAADRAAAALVQARNARQAIDAAAAAVRVAVTATRFSQPVADFDEARREITVTVHHLNANGLAGNHVQPDAAHAPRIELRAVGAGGALAGLVADAVVDPADNTQFKHVFDVAAVPNGTQVVAVVTDTFVAGAGGGPAAFAAPANSAPETVTYNYGYANFQVFNVNAAAGGAAIANNADITTGAELGQPVYFRIQLLNGVANAAANVDADGAFRLEVVGPAVGTFFTQAHPDVAIGAPAGVALAGAGGQRGNADLANAKDSYEFYFVPTAQNGANPVQIQVTDLLHPLAGAAHVQTFNVPIVAPYIGLPVSAAGIVRHDIEVASGEPAAGVGANEAGNTINTSFTGPLHGNGNLGVIDVEVQLKDGANHDLARAVKFKFKGVPLAGVEVRAGTSAATAAGGALPAIGAGAGAINDFTTGAATGRYAFHIVYTGDADMVLDNIHLVEDRAPGPLQNALDIAAYNRAQTAAAAAGGAAPPGPPAYTADIGVVNAAAAAAGAPIRPVVIDVPLNFGLAPDYGFKNFAVTEAGAAAPAPFAHTAVVTAAPPGTRTKSFMLYLDPAAITIDKLAFNVEYNPARGALAVTGTTGAANAAIGPAAAPAAAGAGGPLLYPLTLNAGTTNVTFEYRDTGLGAALPTNADIKFIPLVPLGVGDLVVHVTFQNYHAVTNVTNDLVFRTTNALPPSERVQKEAEEAWKNVTAIAPIDEKYSVLRDPKNWLQHLASPETRRSLYVTLGDFIKYLTTKQAELVQAHPGTFKPTAGVAAGTPYSADDFKQLELFLSYSIVRELVKGAGVIHKIKLRFGSAPPAPVYTDVSYFQPDQRVFDAWRGYVFLKVISALTVSCVLFTYAFHPGMASPATKQFLANAASRGLIVEHEVSLGRERVKLITCMTAECAEQFERMEPRAPHWTQVALRRLNGAGELELEIHKFVTPTFLYAFMDFFSNFGGREFSA
jgi:hypothetical protein